MSTTARTQEAAAPLAQLQSELAFVRNAKANPGQFALDRKSLAARLREAERALKNAVARLDEASAAYFKRTDALLASAAPAEQRIFARRDLHGAFNRALATVQFQSEIVVFYRERLAREIVGRDINKTCPRCLADAHVSCPCR